MSFEERSNQAMDRRKVPSDADPTIHLPDQSNLTPDQPSILAQKSTPSDQTIHLPDQSHLTPDQPSALVQKNTPPAQVGKLRYAALDDGPGFFNEDGSRHQFSSPEERSNALQAMAHHMATGEQTPGVPELDLVMLNQDGTAPDLNVLPPNPPPPPATDGTEEFGPITNGFGPIQPGVANVQLQNLLDPSRFRRERGADGVFRFRDPETDDLYTEGQVDMMVAARQLARLQNPPADQAQTQQQQTQGQQQGPQNAQQIIPDPNRIHAQPQAPAQDPNYFGNVPRFIRRRFSNPIPPQQPPVLTQPPTLDVIIGNDKQREDLFELLKTGGRVDLIERYHRSKDDPSAMRDEDWNELTRGFLPELQRRTLLEQEVRSNLSAEDIRYMLDNSLAFAPIRASLKPERAQEVIKAYLHNVFMRSSDTDIDRMVFAQRANRDVRNSKQYVLLKERTQMRLGVAGLSPENVQWQMVNPQMIRNILRPGFFTFDTLRTSAETQNAVTSNLNTVTTILGAAIKNDPLLHSRIINEVETGQQVPETILTGPRTFQEATAETTAGSRALDLPALRTSVPAFRQRVGDRWGTMTPQQRKQEFFEPIRQQQAQRERRQSWFSSLIASLFNSLTSRAERDPQLDAAFAAA